MSKMFMTIVGVSAKNTLDRCRNWDWRLMYGYSFNATDIMEENLLE
jgi:hypothetical protein